jgi:DHA2 family multidrug resistance protein
MYEAQARALKLVDLAVVKQSALMSYLDSYLLIGALFVLAMPLLAFVVKRTKKQPAHVNISDH